LEEKVVVRGREELTNLYSSLEVSSDEEEEEEDGKKKKRERKFTLKARELGLDQEDVLSRLLESSISLTPQSVKQEEEEDEVS